MRTIHQTSRFQQPHFSSWLRRKSRITVINVSSKMELQLFVEFHFVNLDSTSLNSSPGRKPIELEPCKTSVVSEFILLPGSNNRNINNILKDIPQGDLNDSSLK